MDDANRAVVRELEEVTGLALALLRKLGQPEIAQRYQFYVPAIFKAICLNADSVLRLHPLSVFYSELGERVWNPAAIAGLARMLMEACADLYYFAGRDGSQGEREFRGIIADLQRVRARIRSTHAAERRRATGPPRLSEPHPLLERDGAWAEMLPDQQAFWLAQLERNSHFGSLPASEKEAWRTGQFARRAPRYWRNGYVLGRAERARRAGIAARVHRDLYGLLSEYTHTSAKGLDRIFWFYPFDHWAIQIQVTMPVGFCCGFVAHAAAEFAEVFPDCKAQLTPDLWSLVSRGRSYITTPQGG